MDIPVSQLKQLVMRACHVEMLEKALSNEMVYLGFQDDLQHYSGNKRKERLAEIVCLLLSETIFENPTIRTAIAEREGINAPKTWSAGSEQAVEFCDLLGLPRIFAGFKRYRNLSPYEVIYGPPKIGPLQDYQEESVTKTIQALSSDRKALLSLPTGGGKTRTATEVIYKLDQSSSGGINLVWVAHTEELCEQAIETIKSRWTSDSGCKTLMLTRAWGNNLNRVLKKEQFTEQYSQIASSGISKAWVTTPVSLLKLLDAPPPQFPTAQTDPDSQTILVIDEAHRAAADTYKTCIKRLSGFNSYILGLSATPLRSTYSSELYSGTEELAALFMNLIEPTESLGCDKDPAMVLTDMGYLSRLRVENINVNDNTISDVARAITHSLKKTNSGKAMVFNSTVAEARITAVILREAGIRAHAVSSADSKNKRLLTRDLFAQGKIQVICNCELLTTGFDAPNVSHIYLARRTDSQVLYKQIIGRGLRGEKFGGTATCTLYLCGIDLPFDPNPNTTSFARSIWNAP